MTKVYMTPRHLTATGALLSRVRAFAGLDHAAFGEILGMSHDEVVLSENGMLMPRPDQLHALADAILDPDGVYSAAQGAGAVVGYLRSFDAAGGLPEIDEAKERSLEGGDETPIRPIDAYAVTLGIRIRKARQERRMTQKELATRVGKSRSAIAQWESGHAVPPVTSIVEAATVLATDPGKLAFGY